MRFARFNFLLLIGYALITTLAVAWVFTGQGFSFVISLLTPLLGFAFSLSHAFAALGWQRASLMFVVTIFISALFEGLGVSQGWIFGAYEYTYRLGPLLFGLFPPVIPLTWFTILYLSYQVAELILAERMNAAPHTRILAVAVLGGVAALSWDIMLDPLMTLREHWVWEEAGDFYGVPWENFIGWWLTGFTVLILVQWLWLRIAYHKGQVAVSFRRLAVWAYLLTGLGTFSQAIGAGLTLPALLGGGLMGIWVLLGVSGKKLIRV